MALCKKCDEKFSIYVIIDGVRKNLGNRKYCLKCSPFGRHNTKQLSKVEHDDLEKECVKCKEIKSVSQFYVRSNKEGVVVYRSYCIPCWKKESVLRQERIKLKCLDYKGRVCEVCGYMKCAQALEFHHREKQYKEFSISDMRSMGWERLKKELDKCDLLCCRCHRELETELKYA